MSNVGFAISGRPTGQDTLANGLFQEMGIEDSLYFSGLSGDIVLEPGEQVAVIAQRSGNGGEQAYVIAWFEYAESHGPNRPGGFIGAAVALHGLPKPVVLGKVLFDLFRSALTLIDPTTRKFKSASKNEWDVPLPSPDENLVANLPSWFVRSPLRTDERMVVQAAGDLRLILWSIAQALILNPRFNGKGTIMVTTNNTFISKAATRGIPKVGMFELLDYQALHESQARKLNEAQRELTQAKTNIEQEVRNKKALEDERRLLDMRIQDQNSEIKKNRRTSEELNLEIRQLEERRKNIVNKNREFDYSRSSVVSSHQQGHNRQNDTGKSQTEKELIEYINKNKKLTETNKIYKYFAISTCFSFLLLIIGFALDLPPFQETIIVQNAGKMTEQQQMNTPRKEMAKVSPPKRRMGNDADRKHRLNIREYLQMVQDSADTKSIESMALRGFLFREVLLLEDSKSPGATGSLKSDFQLLTENIKSIEDLLKSKGIHWKYASPPKQTPRFSPKNFDNSQKAIEDTLMFYDLLYRLNPDDWGLEEKTFSSSKADVICKEYLNSNNDIYNITSDKDINDKSRDSLVISHLRWMIRMFNEEKLGMADADISLSSKKKFIVPVLKKQ
jgi:hypothetical protein